MSFTRSTADAAQEASTDSSTAAFERNAFRMLSLPADAQARDIYRQQQRIQNALELGDDDVASRFRFLPEVALSAEAVLEAVHRIERNRALEEIFWVHQYGDKFNSESENVDAVLSNLRADAGRNTTNGSIAQHNLAVIFTCLAQGLKGSRRVDYWRDAVRYWNATLANDLFWQFMRDRGELADGNGRPPAPADLRSIAGQVVQSAMLNEIWFAIDNRDYNQIAALLAVVREYKHLFDADSTLNAIGSRMAKDGLVIIGGILDRLSAVREGTDKTLARSTLDAAEKELRKIGDDFDAIARAFGPTDAFARLYDARADALKRLSVAYFNFAEDQHEALRLATEAGNLARDQELKREAWVGCKHIRRSIACSEATALMEQKNYAGAQQKLATALALSSDEQKAEILELQQGVHRARILGDVDKTQRSPSLSTINGIGARFYGMRDFDAETNSYITVHWFTLLFFPIVPIASYRVSDRGHDLYTIYGRVPLTSFLRNYRWAVLAVLAILLILVLVNSGSSNAGSGSTYTPPSVSSEQTASPSTGDSQTSEGSAIEAERADLKSEKDSLDLRKQQLDQDRADLERLKSYIDSVNHSYTPETVPEDVREEYNTTFNDYKNRTATFNTAVDSYNSDFQQHHERVVAFNERVRRYNANR